MDDMKYQAMVDCLKTLVTAMSDMGNAIERTASVCGAPIKEQMEACKGMLNRANGLLSTLRSDSVDNRPESIPQEVG